MSTRKRTRSSALEVATEACEPIDVYVTPVASVKTLHRVDGISDYERERMENIQRNEKFLASLGLNNVKSALHQSVAARVPPKRKVVAVRKIASDAPVRRSGRVTIDKLQENIARLEESGDTDALAAKQLELDEMLAKRQEGSYQAVIDASSSKDRDWRRVDDGPIPMDNMAYAADQYNKDQANLDVKGLALEMNSSHKRSRTDHTNRHQSIDEYTAALQRLTICDSECAKLTENRLTSVFVHPISEKIVIFGGDKSGNFGVWDVSKLETSDVLGVYKYEPHVSAVARIDASPLDPTSVFSVSYDGTVRQFDTEKEQFTLAFKAPEDNYGFYFTDANFLNDMPRCMYVSTNEGSVGLLDFRASDRAYQWKREGEQGYKTNSVQQHPTQPHLLVTAERNVVYLYDVRKGGSGDGGGGGGSSSSKATSGSMKALSILEGHTHSVNAAYISPDGQYLISVGQENTLRTWRNFLLPGQAADCVVTRHDNHTGRWLSTFRPTFDPKQPHAFALGSMLQPRRVEIFSPMLVGPEVDVLSSVVGKGKPGGAKSGAAAKGVKKENGVERDFELRLLHNAESEWLGSVCSRNAFHPTLNVLVGGNSSGRVHVFRERSSDESV